MIGPEAPGVVPSGPFRGADKGLKPQAARFRIYKVEIDANENETVVEEIIAGKDIKIKWSASLANRKAAGFFISDTLQRVPNPRPRNNGLDRKKLVIAANGSVTGSGTLGPVLSGAIEFAKPRAGGTSVKDIVLAKLQTDEAGRLLVVGGPGTSGSLRNAPIEIVLGQRWVVRQRFGWTRFGRPPHTRSSSNGHPGVGRRDGTPLCPRDIRHRHLV